MSLENDFLIQEALTKGLRNSRRPALNRPWLAVCKNLKPTELGLERHEPVQYKDGSYLRYTTGSFINLITNGTFATDTSWTKSGKFVISGGVASVNDPAGSDTFTEYWKMKVPSNYISQNPSLTENYVYRLSITVSSYTSGILQVFVGSNSGKQLTFGNRFGITAAGTYSSSFMFTSDDTSLITIQAIGMSKTVPQGAVLSIDNVTLARVGGVGWPYPQLFKMQNQTLLASADTIYEVDESADWEQAVYDYHSALTIKDAYFPLNDYTISGGSIEPWHVADFGRVYFMCNGSDIVYKVPSSGVAVSTSLVGLKDLNIGAVGKYRSRMYWGGVGTTPTSNPNLATNGTFDYDGNNSYGWSLNSGWTVASNKLVGTATSTFALQYYPFISLTAGASYSVVFTISDYSAGTVTPILVTTDGTARSANGTYTETIVAPYGGAASILSFIGSSFTGKIDNISITLVTDSYFDTDAWADIWSNWLLYVGENDPYALTDEDMVFGTNWICWSQAAGGDVYYPFAEFLAMFGIPNSVVYDKLKVNIIHSIRHGDIGFLQMPWEGEIYYLAELGNHLIVYGENGVSAVMANPTNGLHTVQSILSIGVIGRGAIAGDEKEHVFLDKSGTLWRINQSIELEKLGYENDLYDNIASTYATDAIVMSLDQRTRDYFICNSNYGYIFANNTLSQITQRPSTIQYIDGVIAGFAMNSSGDSGFTVETDTFDLGNRAVKTIHNIHIGYYDADDVQVQVKYRYADSPVWYTNTAQDINDEGVVTPVVSGVDFRVVVTGTLKEDTKIDYINIRWRLSDKRSVRGRL